MDSDHDLLAQDRPDHARQVFDAIVERHGPMVFGVGLRVLRDHHEAEDVVQLTFTQLAKHPEATSSNLAGWLHRTATNFARQILRSRVRRVRREALTGSKMVATPQNNADELREEIDAALDRLPADLREVVILHYLEDCDYEETATISGCTQDAVRKRAQRGLHRLRHILAGRGVVCGLDALASFLACESAARALVPASVFEGLCRDLAHLSHGQAAARIPGSAIKEALRTKVVGSVAAAVLVGGVLGLLGFRALARRGVPAASAVETDPASVQPTVGWSPAARARFRALSLRGAATVASSGSIFRSGRHDNDGLTPPFWGEFTARGIPFLVDEPQGGTVPNLIVLHSSRGDLSRRYPRSAAVPCGVPARAIHLLSGVSGWGFPSRFPRDRGGTVSMIVRLKYAGGAMEDHPLLDAVHFTYYYTLDDVPGSRRAIVLKGKHQMRHVVITPGRSAPIEQIEFLAGPDEKAPVVMAVTVEVAEKRGR